MFNSGTNYKTTPYNPYGYARVGNFLIPTKPVEISAGLYSLGQVRHLPMSGHTQITTPEGFTSKIIKSHQGRGGY